MSADLMVFDKSRAPVEPREFLKWFYEKTTWTSDRDYYDIKGASPKLVDFSTCSMSISIGIQSSKYRRSAERN